MSAHRSNCPDEALVAAAQRGDRAAFDALAERYRSGLLAVTLDLSRSVDVAEDLAQEALARAWGHIGELRDPAVFGPWLRRIAINCFRMWQRRPWPEELPEREPAAAGPDPAEHARRMALLRALHAELRALPRQNRLALLMRALGGASYGEIARFLGVPERTVAGRIYRARRELRVRVGAWLDED